MNASSQEVTQADYEKLFSLMDKNKDGKVTYEDILELSKSYLEGVELPTQKG